MRHDATGRTRPRRLKNRATHRADTRSGAWLGIPHAVVKSAAYEDLSILARAVLIEIALRFGGYNNGQISVSQREIATRLSNSNYGKIGRAIAELMEHGLIDVAFEGEWKPRCARRYRLTWVSTGTDERPVPATNDYLHWKKQPRVRVERVSAKASKSAEASLARLMAVADGVSAGCHKRREKTTSSRC